MKDEESYGCNVCLKQVKQSCLMISFHEEIYIYVLSICINISYTIVLMPRVASSFVLDQFQLIII